MRGTSQVESRLRTAALTVTYPSGIVAVVGPLTSTELAERTRMNERYVIEWLVAQTCSGYILYDPKTCRYTLPAEHSLVLGDENSPVNLLGVTSSNLSQL